MAYHVLPESPKYYVEHDVGWPGSALYVVILLAGSFLACFVGAALAVLIHPDLNASQIGVDPPFVLPVILAMLSISRVIKSVMLKRMGGAAHLGFTTWSWGVMIAPQSWRYMDVYAPDTYLTRAEFMRVTLTPHAMSLAVMAVLLAFALPMLQFAAILGFAAKALDILIPLINLVVALRCPPGSLFVESGGGILDAYRAAQMPGR